jgi:hypothetical protein
MNRFGPEPEIGQPAARAVPSALGLSWAGREL